LVKRSILQNIVLQYTLISFLVTFSVSLYLINSLTNKTINHSTMIHSKTYINFINTIETNYPSLINSLLTGKKFNEEEHHDFEHFVSDLLIFPQITNIHIFSGDHNSVYEYSASNVRKKYLQKKDYIDKAFSGEFNYFLQDNEEDDNQYLHSFYPIMYKEKVIGIVEIIDSDSDFKSYLKQSEKEIIQSITLGGFVFYILLFFIFFKSYQYQNKIFKRLHKSQELTIHAMSLLAELRDDDTGAHIIRTREYCRLLAIELKKRPDYSKYLTKEYIEDLERSAPLHDIGKVGLPDSILLKPGKLTPEEFEIIKKHPKHGADVLLKVAESLDYKSYFDIGIQVVLHHHENWDGSGYPNSLKGEDIPLSARIMAIADVYDALRSKRTYKKSMSHEEARTIIISESGKKFDPLLIEAFINIEHQFKLVSNKTNILF